MRLMFSIIFGLAVMFKVATVSATPIISVDMDPGTAGIQSTLTVTGTFIDGNTIDLTSTGTGTNYNSSDLTVANFGITDGTSGLQIMDISNLLDRANRFRRYK